MVKSSLNLKSFAKINLFLDVIGKLPDGYHEINTIFQTIDLYDEIFIQKLTQKTIRLTCNNNKIPIDNDSLLYQIAKRMTLKSETGIAIHLKKNIPIAAGLGGGSSNAATLMLGINEIFDLNWGIEYLTRTGLQYGMDIPFFFYRGTAFASGRGEKIVPLFSIQPPLNLLLVNPGLEISTQWAYQAVDQNPCHSLRKELKDTINPYRMNSFSLNHHEVKRIVFNRFEAVVSKRYPKITQIKETLLKNGAIVASLTGSGPTVFAVMNDAFKAEKIYHTLKDQFPFVILAQTIDAKDIKIY